METTTVIAIVVAAAAVALAIIVAVQLAKRRRSHALRDRFGSEYERTVDQADSRREAERELRERQERREQLHIVPLDPAARTRYAQEWLGVQQRFVDAPAECVAEADVLVMQVMRERGYPVDDFDQRAADISVDHPDLVEHYRSAHAIAARTRAGAGNTEELREAVVHYRALFVALLDEDPTVDLTDRRDDRVVDVRDEAMTADRSRPLDTGRSGPLR